MAINYVDEKFSKAFSNFINDIIEECKYCSEVMKNNFDKKVVINKENNEDFENSANCQICDLFLL